MSNVYPIRGDNDMLVELAVDKLRLEALNEVYRGCIIDLCNDIDSLLSCIDHLSDPFRKQDVEKLTDKVRAATEKQRLVVGE